jgi:tetratricopeptide (TPR) repeat protein
MLQKGNAAGAEAAASKAIEQKSGGAQMYAVRGAARARRGDHKAAAADYTAALQKGYQSSGDALAQRSYSNTAMGSYGSASQDADALVMFRPMSAPAQQMKETAHATQKKVEENPAAFRPPLPPPPPLPVEPPLDEEDRDAGPDGGELARQAAAWLAAGRPEQALALAQRAAALAPRDPFPQTIRAAALNKLERWSEAAQAATEALRRQPRAMEILLLRSEALLSMSRCDEAEADASVVIDVAPRDVRGYAQRAKARNCLGDKDGAREDLRRANALGGFWRDTPERGAFPWAWASILAAILATAAVASVTLRRRYPR